MAKKKQVRKPIRTRYGHAAVTKSHQHKGLMEIRTISTGNHDLDPSVFYIEEAYQNEDPEMGVFFKPDVVIRDYVEDQKILKNIDAIRSKLLSIRGWANCCVPLGLDPEKLNGSERLEITSAALAAINGTIDEMLADDKPGQPKRQMNKTK